ncbi:hypothetical protein D9758_014511 [Tetrapyrgos nigripes]|uniref:DUF6534 domain-containing protein n=1 Tax=Tetrapyrgos nigripes TaxID=182062 RepID=A0A8H5CUC6_9AGAR|nr:hypothetical protein D9758_014511 [Tetrapyrgos nigripes]
MNKLRFISCGVDEYGLVMIQNTALVLVKDMAHTVWLTIPRLIGFAFNWGLMGALTVQVYIYHISFRSDRATFKALVYILYLLEWAQTCSATYDAAQWFGYGWGNEDALNGLYSSYLNVPIFTSTIGAAVQIFFGWRIFTLSQSRALFGFVILMALTQLAGAAVAGYFIYIDPSESGGRPGFSKAVGVRLGTSAAVDIVIASCMIYFLLRDRSDLSVRTNAVVTKRQYIHSSDHFPSNIDYGLVVRLTIETGTITATAAIIDLVFFLTLHDNAMHQVSGVTLSKLYTNSLLMLFNNRMKLSSMMASVGDSGRENAPSHCRGQEPLIMESYEVFNAAKGVHSSPSSSRMV